MKHSIVVKFLAFLIATLSVVGSVGGAAGIVAMESAGLYVGGLDALQGQEYDSAAREIAEDFTELYATQSLGDIPYSLKANYFSDPANRPDADHWTVQLRQDGVLLAEEGEQTGAVSNCVYSREFTISPMYIIASLYSPADLQTLAEPTEEAATSIPDSEIQPRSSLPEPTPVPDGYLYYSQESIWQNGFITYYLYYYQAPEYTVTVYLKEGVLETSSLYMLTTLYPHRYTFIILLAVGLMSTAVCIVYLIWSAGHCADGSIRPGGLNRLPLDLYALLAGGGLYALAVLFFRLLEWMESEGPHLGNLSLLAVNLAVFTLLALAFLFAFSAQVKVKHAFWWRHSITGWFCGRIAALFRLIGRGISAVVRILPLVWRWVLLVGAMGMAMIFTLVLGINNDFFLLLFLAEALLTVALVFYCSYCFATLMKGARQMSRGDLGCKIETTYLRGSFRDFALQLNSLSETALIAARKQMQSERMKTELITNVSHDIKTPLTSIINFVDLLRRPHSEDQQQEYLEVLSRQSARLKKLIDDLMELSKASSGSISVHLETLDAAETVNQALGEFSDKLETAGLCSIFRQPEQPVMITADGRLMWRVLSNLLSNAVKYAMPGTRLYVDLVQVENQVLLSLKNISREPLNIDSEELLERFVRGDASRNSDGSGLGLNIAQNLMEVQGGKLQLLLDGDLFKVTLVFPSAS